MLDAYSQAASSHAAVQSASVDAVDSISSADMPMRPSRLSLMLHGLESQLGMLLATFHDDVGFWAAFAKLMQHLDEDLDAAKRARLRSQFPAGPGRDVVVDAYRCDAGRGRPRGAGSAAPDRIASALLVRAAHSRPFLCSRALG